MIKSIIARQIFQSHPEVKKVLWGGEFWSDGYYANTVSRFGYESTITKYVKEQGIEKNTQFYTKKHNPINLIPRCLRQGALLSLY